jgi:hypothetical protein
MCAGLLYRILPLLLCGLGYYREGNLGCYMCWTFIPSITMVVMCAGLLNLVLPWLLCVLDLYAKYHLRCYVC